MVTASEKSFVEALDSWNRAFTQHMMQGFMAHAKKAGLSMAQIGALMHLRQAVGTNINHMSDSLGVTSAAVSQLIDRLVQSGLVDRHEDPDDRRAKRIELTELGLRIVNEAMSAKEQWFRDLAARLSDDERRQAQAALMMLAERASMEHGENQ